MKRQEDIIRDYLADHLGWLQPGLLLIKKEFQLDNQHGSKGFIDILARDADRNFIIIEIKRSDKAARETLTEINKYIGLLKQNYRVKESEIKCLIVAVEWRELLVPFSEFVSHSKYFIQGISLKVDSEQIPVSFSVIEPLPENQFSRGYSPFHAILEYRERADREQALSYVRSIIRDCGINDFVLLSVENSGRQEIIYPYAICIGFQCLSEKEYENIMARNHYETGMSEEDWEDYSEEEKLFSLYDFFVAMFEFHTICDELESIPREVFVQMIVTSGWQVTSSEKWGIFESDPRYDDDLMMVELGGATDGNDTIYVNTVESDHIYKMQEIREKFRLVLGDMREWEEHIDHILDDLAKEKSKYRLMISIANPTSLLAALVRGFEENSEEYLPIYLVQADFEEFILKFQGFVVWNGKTPDINRVVDWLKKEKYNNLYNLAWGEDKELIMEILQLVTFHGIGGMSKDGIPIQGGALNYNGKSEGDFQCSSINQYFKHNAVVMQQLQRYVGNISDNN